SLGLSHLRHGLASLNSFINNTLWSPCRTHSPLQPSVPAMRRVHSNARETVFPGHWCPTESVVTDLRLSTATPPEHCADSPLDCVSCARSVLDPRGLLGKSDRQW